MWIRGSLQISSLYRRLVRDPHTALIRVSVIERIVSRWFFATKSLDFVDESFNMRQMKGKPKETNKQKKERKKEFLENKKYVFSLVLPTFAAVFFVIFVYIYLKTRPKYAIAEWWHDLSIILFHSSSSSYTFEVISQIHRYCFRLVNNLFCFHCPYEIHFCASICSFQLSFSIYLFCYERTLYSKLNI